MSLGTDFLQRSHPVADCFLRLSGRFRFLRRIFLRLSIFRGGLRAVVFRPGVDPSFCCLASDPAIPNLWISPEVRFDHLMKDATGSDQNLEDENKSEGSSSEDEEKQSPTNRSPNNQQKSKSPENQSSDVSNSVLDVDVDSYASASFVTSSGEVRISFTNVSIEYERYFICCWL